MFSIMPNMPTDKRAANHHLSSFRDRQNQAKKKVKVGGGGQGERGTD